MYDNYPDDLEDLVAEDRKVKAYHKALANHPDYRDPDHPDPEDYGITYEEQLELDL